MNDDEPSTSWPLGSSENPSTQGALLASSGRDIEAQAQDNHRISSDFGALQECAGGMTKILPSNIDVSGFLKCKCLTWVEMYNLYKSELRNNFKFVNGYTLLEMNKIKMRTKTIHVVDCECE